MHVSNNRARKTITFCVVPKAHAMQLECVAAALFLVVAIEGTIRHVSSFTLALMLAGAAMFALVLLMQARASLTTTSATFDGQRGAVTIRRHRPWGPSQTWHAAFSDIIDIVENGSDAYIVIQVTGHPGFFMPYEGSREGTVVQAIADARRLIGLSAKR